MNGIYGKCEADYQSKGPICYVDDPSNCTDLKFSSEVGAHYSWEACGNNHIFISRHEILSIIGFTLNSMFNKLLSYLRNASYTDRYTGWLLGSIKWQSRNHV